MIRYLKAVFQDPKVLQDHLIRFVFFAIGFAPITSVSLSTFEFIPLHYSGPLVVLPAIILAIVLCFRFRSYGHRVLEGLMLGIAAVTIYDMTRMPFLAMGLWPDFIPKIGTYLLNEQPSNSSYSLLHWTLGYIWRYVGNGGGMGLAFYMMIPLLKPSWDRRVAGVVYGVGIFCCLLATVYLSPSGRVYLFDPSVLTATMGLVGHLVYGFVLGMGAHLLQSKNFPQQELRGSLIVDRKMQYGTGAVLGLVAIAICGANFFAFLNFSDLFLDPFLQNNILLERRTFLTVLGVTQLFLIISIFAIVLVVTNRIAGPIHSLRKQLALIRAGELDHEFHLRPNDYLSRELTEEFNATLQAIRQFRGDSALSPEETTLAAAQAARARPVQLVQPKAQKLAQH